MLERPFAAVLGALVLASAPSGAGADSGWSVVLDSDSCCCTYGGGRGTLAVNNDLTRVTYRIDFTLTSAPTQCHIHAPVLPGELPTESPMALTLSGDIENRDCGAQGNSRTVQAVCGILSGIGAVDATLVGQMTDGLAWVVVHTPAFPNGEACGRIRPDITPARATSWGRLKIRYR